MNLRNVATAILIASFLFSLPALAEEVNVSAYLQTRYTISPSATDQFTIPRLRADIWGDVHKNFSYLVELDAVASPALIYGWIDYKPNKITKLRAGRFYYPFGLEYTTSPSRFDTINCTTTLWKLFGYSRDIGLQFSQKFDHLKYDLALVNGADNQTTNDNESKDIVGRFVLNPIKNLHAGLSFHLGKAGSTEAQRERIGAELSYKLESFGLKAEYIHAADGGTQKCGWYLQPAFWFNSDLQGLVRFEYWDPNIQTAGDWKTITTLGINYFFDSAVKLQVNYELKQEEVETNNNALLIQLQLKV